MNHTRSEGYEGLLLKIVNKDVENINPVPIRNFIPTIIFNDYAKYHYK